MVDTFMHPAQTAEERKASPVWSGLHDHFPAACELVARLSKRGNDKHNPGQPLQHARGKSNDHPDCIARHQKDVGTIDPEMGLDHAVHVAWRSMAQLQELAETKYGWPVAPNARPVVPAKTPDLYVLEDGTIFVYELRFVDGRPQQYRAVSFRDGTPCLSAWADARGLVFKPYQKQE